MKKISQVIDSTKNVEKNFENVRKSIKGLYEILKIISPSEDDIYFKLAIDNIIVLYHNFLDIVLNDKGTEQLKKILQNSELKADIPIGNFLKSGK